VAERDDTTRNVPRQLGGASRPATAGRARGQVARAVRLLIGVAAVGVLVAAVATALYFGGVLEAAGLNLGDGLEDTVNGMGRRTVAGEYRAASGPSAPQGATLRLTEAGGNRLAGDFSLPADPSTPGFGGWTVTGRRHRNDIWLTFTPKGDARTLTASGTVYRDRVELTFTGGDRPAGEQAFARS
jgi:hypothetical protein